MNRDNKPDGKYEVNVPMSEHDGGQSGRVIKEINLLGTQLFNTIPNVLSD